MRRYIHTHTHTVNTYMYRLNKFTWKIIQINRDNDNGSEEHWSIKAMKLHSTHSTTNRKLKMEKKNGTVMFIKSVLCFLRFIVYTYSSPTYSGTRWNGSEEKPKERERQRKRAKQMGGGVMEEKEGWGIWGRQRQKVNSIHWEYILNSTPHIYHPIHLRHSIAESANGY